MTSTVDVDKNGTFLRELGGHGHLICKSTVSYDQLQSRQKKNLMISQFAGTTLFYFRWKTQFF